MSSKEKDPKIERTVHINYFPNPMRSMFYLVTNEFHK